MRPLKPRWEKNVASYFRRRRVSRAHAMRECGVTTLGKDEGERIVFHMTPYTPANLKPHTRIRAGKHLGYTLYRMLPVDDLRKLHNPVPDSPWLKWYEMMPKGLAACDLAAFNVYLEEIAKVPPCPFPLLVAKGVWENNAWRTLAKDSWLWGEF